MFVRICSCAHAQSYGAASFHHVLSTVNYKDGIVFSSQPYTVPCVARVVVTA